MIGRGNLIEECVLGRALMIFMQCAVLLIPLGLFGCNPTTEKAQTGEESEAVSGTKNPVLVKKALQLVASRMKSTLPRRINEMTTMVDVKSSNLTLTYFYVIEDPPFGEIDGDDFYEQMAGQLTRSLCNEVKVLSNLKNGVAYAYNYQDNDASIIAEIDFTINDCEDSEG